MPSSKHLNTFWKPQDDAKFWDYYAEKRDINESETSRNIQLTDNFKKTAFGLRALTMTHLSESNKTVARTVREGVLHLENKSVTFDEFVAIQSQPGKFGNQMELNGCLESLGLSRVKIEQTDVVKWWIEDNIIPKLLEYKSAQLKEFLLDKKDIPEFDKKTEIQQKESLESLLLDYRKVQLKQFVLEKEGISEPEFDQKDPTEKKELFQKLLKESPRLTGLEGVLNAVLSEEQLEDRAEVASLRAKLNPDLSEEDRKLVLKELHNVKHQRNSSYGDREENIEKLLQNGEDSYDLPIPKFKNINNGHFEYQGFEWKGKEYLYNGFTLGDGDCLYNGLALFMAHFSSIVKPLEIERKNEGVLVAQEKALEPFFQRDFTSIESEFKELVYLSKLTEEERNQIRENIQKDYDFASNFAQEEMSTLSMK